MEDMKARKTRKTTRKRSSAISGRRLLPLMMSLALALSALTSLVPGGNRAYADEPGSVAYYVSTSGSDSNDGSIDAPFATIQQARDVIRDTKGTMSGDITVYVRGGQYYLNSAISFNEQDSGNNGHDIIYRNYPDETPEIIGGQRITGWTLDSGNVYKANVGSSMGIETLMENDVRSIKARTPNTGYLKAAGSVATGEKNKGFVYKAGDLPDNFDYTNAQFSVWPGSNYMQAVVPISSIDFATRTIRSPYSVDYDVVAGNRYFIQGAKEFLDAPGEFYYDKAAGYLYYYPRNAAINDQVIVAPTTRRILQLMGTSVDAPVSHLVFEGFRFSLSNFTDAFQYYTDANYDGMIFMENAEYNQIRNSEIFNAGFAGVAMNHSAKYNTVYGNHIKDSGTSGVIMNNYYYGEGSFTSAENGYVNKFNTVSNNLIEQGGLFIGNSPGINMHMSGDNTITHNVIRNFPYIGIMIGGEGFTYIKPKIDQGLSIYGTVVTLENRYDFNYARNNLIAYNDVSDVMKDSQDGGIIYTWGSGKGNVIDHNRVHDTNGGLAGDNVGIYLDDSSNNVTITNNIIDHNKNVSSPFLPLLVKGADHFISNNVLADNDKVNFDITVTTNAAVDDPTTNITYTKNIIYTPNGSGIYRFYPNKAYDADVKKFVAADNNVFYHPGGTYTVAGLYANSTTYSFAQWQGLYSNLYDQHSITGTDPQFEDAAHGNYALKASSPALALGITSIDQSEIGLLEDFPFDATLPETPTVEPPSPTTNLLLGKVYTSSSTNEYYTVGAPIATDGDKSDSGAFANLGSTGGTGLQWIQFDLGQSYLLGKVNLWHYFADGRTYHDVIIQVSDDPAFATSTTVFNNDTDNSAGQGAGTDAEYAESAAGKTVAFTPVSSRYLRIWSNGSTGNDGNHYVEVEAYVGEPVEDPGPSPDVNLVAGLVYTSSSTNPNYPIGAPLATNGKKNDTGEFANLGSGGGDGLQWVQFDLGKSYNVGKVNLWHYFGDGRTYHDVIIQVSNDPTFVTNTTVFNNDTDNSAGQGTGTDAEYAESAAGQTFEFAPVNARYVRLWSNGSTGNSSNHYVEIEVYVGTGSPTTVPTTLAKSFYVAPDGSDYNAGTLAAPFATVQRARDVIRANKGTMTEDIHVYVKGGIYYQKDVIAFNEQDAGNNNFKVIYQNYDETEPQLVGGKAITGWSLVSGQVYKANVGIDWDIKALTENGARSMKARMPNAGVFDFKVFKGMGNKTQFGYNPDDIPDSLDLAGAQVVIWNGDGFRENTSAIQSIDHTNHVITLSQPTDYEIMVNNRYYLQGARSLLDAPGEYYFDKTAGEVVYYPKNEDIANQWIVAPVLNSLMSVSNATGLVVQGLNMNLTNGTLLSISNSSNVEIKFNKLLNAGGTAISISGAGNGNLLYGNLIRGSGGISVVMGGTNSGVGDTFENNIIEDGAKFRGSDYALRLAGSGYNLVKHNLIRNFPYIGMFVYSGHNLISYNEITDTMRDGQDGGLIYNYWDAPGNVYDHNRLHHNVGGIKGDHVAFYLDDWSSYVTLTNNIVDHNKNNIGNTFYPFEIKGVNNTIRNNISAFNQLGEKNVEMAVVTMPNKPDYVPDADHPMQFPTEGVTFENNIFYTVKGTYMYDLYPSYNLDTREGHDEFASADYNVFYHPDGSYKVRGLPQDESFENWKTLAGGKYDQHSVTADPLFTDADNFDFTLQEGSPALALGFLNIDQSEIGLKADFPFDRTAPILPDPPTDPDDSPIVIEPNDPNAGTHSVPAVADAYVADGDHASDNFGSDAALKVQAGGEGATSQSYLKFDLNPEAYQANMSAMLADEENWKSDVEPVATFQDGTLTLPKGTAFYYGRKYQNEEIAVNFTSPMTAGSWLGFILRGLDPAAQVDGAYKNDYLFIVKPTLFEIQGYNGTTFTFAKTFPNDGDLKANTSTILKMSAVNTASGVKLTLKVGDKIVAEYTDTGNTNTGAGYFGMVNEFTTTTLQIEKPAIYVDSATLRVYGSGDDATVYADGVANNSWSENGINWSNAPAGQSASGSGVVVGSEAKYYEFDVSSALRNADLSSGIASLLLRGDLGENRLAEFSSKESAHPPELTFKLGAVRMSTDTGEDTQQVQAVIDLIAALPEAADVTLDDETAIADARAAYEDLNVEQQSQVTNLMRLTDAEAALAALQASAQQVQAVIDLIAALPEAADVTLDDAATIANARAAYDALGGEQQSEVSNLSLLTAAAAALANLQAAAPVIDLIAAIPTPVTLSDDTAAAIANARAAYNALSEEQQSEVSNLQILTDAEAALAILQAAQPIQAVIDLIAAIPTPVTLGNATAITNARAAYNALSGEQQSEVTNLQTLTDAEEALADLKADIEAVIDLIQGLPTPVTLSDVTAIANARAAYNALNSEQKLQVSNLQNLTDAEAALAILQAAQPIQAVIDLIAGLPTSITLGNATAIANARAAYNALNDDQQSQVTNLAHLAAAETALAALQTSAQQVQTVIDLIAALPDVAAVKQTDSAAIANARAKYNALSESQRGQVTNLSRLSAAEAALSSINTGSTNTGNTGSTNTGNIPSTPGTFQPEVGDGGVAKAGISKSDFDKASAAASTDAQGVKMVNLKLNEAEGASAYALEMPSDIYTAGQDKSATIVIDTPVGSIDLPNNMFKAEDLKDASRVEISLTLTDAADLDPALKNKIGDRPVVELNVTIDGKPINWNNQSTPVTVAIKYPLSEEELNDPEFNPDFLTVWYIDGKGKAVKVPNAKYNADAGEVVFTTTHFSMYAVLYDHSTFDDLTKVGWAKSAIEALSAKGILAGETEQLFRPAANITRAEFLGGLIRALGLTAEAGASFSDVPVTNAYYQEIGAARALGITSGIGNNVFGSDLPISRQDMMVLVRKALDIAGIPSGQADEAALSGFKDQGAIAAYARSSASALVHAGIIHGESAEKLNPTGQTTKAAAAVLLYQLFKLSN